MFSVKGLLRVEIKPLSYEIIMWEVEVEIRFEYNFHAILLLLLAEELVGGLVPKMDLLMRRIHTKF